MDVSDGKASPLFKKGADDFAVRFLLSFPAEYIPKHLRLQWVMPPEGGITAAHDEKIPASCPGSLYYVSGDLAVGLFCLVLCKASGVGKNIEQVPFLLKALQHGFL